MPLQATSGAASQDAYGGNGVAVVPAYIEDVFSTYLWTGTGATRTITNDIDLSTKGGLVWIKTRSAGENHCLTDTARTADFQLASSTTGAQTNEFNRLTAFTTSGFSLSTSSLVNASAATYVGWTFRKQPKFFDVVTYTGNGTTQNIAHNLGSVPGMVIIKRASGAGDWNVWHRSLTSGRYIWLNYTSAEQTGGAANTFGNNTTTVDPTSSVFTVGSSSDVNSNGGTMVAYLFAHNAGGFGLTGTDNVISCGTFTSNATVTLGYEPQWVMVKATSGTGDWMIADTMRGMSVGSTSIALYPNLSSAEGNDIVISPTATGFTTSGYSGTTFIYIAIRRGPMKVPTVGTSVYANSTRSATAPAWTSNFPVDWFFQRTTSADNWGTLSRLTGTNQLRFNTTDAATTATEFKFDFMNGINGSLYADSTDYGWMMRRAPSFFDVVCYTGTGSARTVSHNLAAVPELVINKNRDSTFGWYTCFNFTSTTYDQNTLSTTNAANTAVTYGTGGDMFSAKPTTTGLPLSAGANNLSAKTYVSYLFATCSGVSKVGSYTGTGALQTVNCGFTSGARFVLIKRTDSTGDWWTYDSARGITSGNDPYLFLNSTAAEVTSTNYVDTDSTGFKVTAAAPAGLNASGGTYIFLAIA